MMSLIRLWMRLSALGVAGVFVVAGCSPSAGEGADAGGLDAGTRDDASMPEEDAGLDGDAGAFDAGPPVDAGPPIDAGPMPDAGPRPDAGPLDCVSVEATPTGNVWEDPNGRAEVSVSDREGCTRTYTLRTTATLRDGRPDNPRIVREEPGDALVRSGHDYFDGLHALALDEVEELSVDMVRDFAFNEGAGVSCGTGGCFETGRLWNYVWTRDTAYAVDLGLAPMSPTRALNSLSFKLSERRAGGDEQIVQDTGTGGSYPVSSDRVSWALGAWTLLAHLDGAERTAFRDRAYNALRNTIEHDRGVVYDARDGLYRGEQSFLDWREQTYPEWTATARGAHRHEQGARHEPPPPARDRDRLDARRATPGDASARADRYQRLGRATCGPPSASIFWIADEGLFSTYVTTGARPGAGAPLGPARERPSPILFGVASEAQAASGSSRRYPHYGPGAPVVWPQQQADAHLPQPRGVAVRHGVLAARGQGRGDNPAVAERMVRTRSMRGAAINLSNMENFEAGERRRLAVDEGDFERAGRELAAPALVGRRLPLDGAPHALRPRGGAGRAARAAVHVTAGHARRPLRRHERARIALNDYPLARPSPSPSILHSARGRVAPARSP